MKILLISSYLPYPLHSGGHVRLYNLLKELSGRHKITLICEKRDNQTESDVKEIEKICEKVITVKKRKQWSLQNIFKTAASSHSFLVTGHTNAIMKLKIQEELDKNQFDLIHVETFYVAQNFFSVIARRNDEGIPSTTRLPRSLSVACNDNIPIVLVEHNIEYQVYSRFVKNAPFLLRPFLTLDIYKMKKEEEYFWKKASRLVAVSEEDKKVMASKGVDAAVIANGVDPGQFKYKNIQKTLNQIEKKVLFIGDFKWIQNRDTLTWIIKDIWPLIKKGHSQIPVIARRADVRISPAGQAQNDEAIPSGNEDTKIKLWVVGRNIPDSIKNLTNDPDILFDEESSSRVTEKIFQEAYVLLAPIRVGGGTSYKILESMSVGAPVIITPLSAQSLDAEDFKEALIGQTPKELADKTLLLLQDTDIYEKISKNARALIEKNYTWKKIATKLEEVYKNIV